MLRSTDSQDDAVKTEVFADHAILTPPNTLARRVTRIADSFGPGEHEAILRAENALDLLSHEFDAWMSSEIDALEAARISALGASDVADLADLFRVSHDIRGQAATLGFPLVGEIADGLCDLVTQPKAPAQKLIDVHVETIRAMVREDVRERDNPVGRALVRRLAQLRSEAAGS